MLNKFNLSPVIFMYFTGECIELTLFVHIREFAHHGGDGVQVFVGRRYFCKF